MGRNAENIDVRGFLPEPGTKQQLNTSSVIRRTASLGASLALTIASATPFTAAPRTAFGAELMKSVGIPESGWGGRCDIPGRQVVIRTSDKVSVAQCEPNHKWYNAGYVHKDPKNPETK